jgi:hypothetical protein
MDKLKSAACGEQKRLQLRRPDCPVDPGESDALREENAPGIANPGRTRTRKSAFGQMGRAETSSLISDCLAVDAVAGELVSGENSR